MKAEIIGKKEKKEEKKQNDISIWTHGICDIYGKHRNTMYGTKFAGFTSRDSPYIWNSLTGSTLT